MTFEILNESRARDLLRDVVNEKGRDYVNDDGINGEGECRYFDPDDGAPSCIVGHVLHKLGITFADVGESNEGVLIGELIDTTPPLPIVIDDNALEILAVAQSRQDQGVSWGGALDAALGAV